MSELLVDERVLFSNQLIDLLIISFCILPEKLSQLFLYAGMYIIYFFEFIYIFHSWIEEGCSINIV